MNSDSNSRGRPRGFEHDEVLTKLVMLFWEKGYEATTQQDMVGRTGLSSSSLFNAFGGKPTIFVAVMQRYTEMQKQGLGTLADGVGGLDDIFVFIDSVRFHVSGEDDCPTSCLAVKTMTGPSEQTELVGDQLENYRKNLTEALGAALRRAAAEGEIDPDPARTQSRAELFTASLIGILAMADTPAGKEPALGMVEALFGAVKDWRIPPAS